MSVQITLTYSTIDEAVSALADLAAARRPPAAAVIARADRPDVGLDPATVFGAVAASVPASPPSAPSTAVAAVPPTAPVGPPATSVTPPAAPLLPAPPTAPAAAAPSAPVVPASPAPVVDSRGWSWDARIHSANKSLNADGTWRQKRGLNDEMLKNRVEAELRQAAGAGAALAVPPAAPPAVPGVPPAPAAPAVPPAPGVETFATLMVRLSGPMVAGKLSPEKITELLLPVGLSSLGQLGARPDLVPAAAAFFDQHLATLA